METFGKYEVVELIGEGGFGRVYRGHDPALKRAVAIKTCTLRHGDMRERFAREAEIAASLRHPNILTVYDFGEHEGEPYLVQEYLGGEDLKAKIARAEPVALATRVDWLRQIADGLRYAHENGVVHRDVKPANIRVLPDGQVRIMDFGIAKLMQADRQLTQVGFSVGTTGYLAPEQLRGDDVDHRADIFSFGVLAYELVSYRQPFEAESVTAILYRIAHEEPPPLVGTVTGCPPRLAACIERCLRKNREERWASLVAVIEELDVVSREIGAIPHAAARLGATAAFDAVTGGAAATGGSHGAEPARGVTVDGARRRSPAMAALLVAALAVAAFGVLNVARWAEPASGDRGEPRAEVDGRENAAAAHSTSADPEPERVDEEDNLAAAHETPSATPEPAAGGSAGGAGTPRPSSTSQPTTDSGTGSSSPAPAPGASSLAAAPLAASSVLVIIDGGPGADVAESALIAELLRGGLSAVDDRASAALRADRLSGDAVRELGRGNETGTILAGALRAAAAPGVGAFVTGSATLTLRAYDANTGRLIDTGTFEIGGRTPGRSAATEDAAIASAAEAVAYQASRWTARLLAGR